ncbi:MAG: tetratricopeptide repeat protein [Candidatus Eremiobacteraeota bacterium]|nr:tetratricopeptide repeat protein [Candidatus Eremiobacteraeota bacterium]
MLAAGDVRGALEAYESALEIDPFELQIHLGLAQAYRRLGDEDSSERHRANAIKLAPMRSVPFRGTNTPIRVLALLASANANVDLEPLLPNDVFAITLAHVDAMLADATLPKHDVIFNAIGDADAAGAALALAEKIVARSDAPLVNHPSAVLKTRRDRNAARLRGRPALRVPRIVRYERERLRGGQADTSLSAAGIFYPFLVRAPGFHNGRYFRYVTDATELKAVLADLPGDELYVMEFIDTRDARGYYLKYRALFIGESILPVHAALSTAWKVHYDAADLAASELGRAIDSEFRHHPRERLGERAYAALESLQRELGLQYGGIDFGLDDGGNLVLFEANATMLPGKASDQARQATVALIHGLLAPRAE